MPKNVAVIIREDPRNTHRPVEALRIALGLVAGTHQTTVVLLGEAVRLLSEDTDDLVDGEILEKYLPSIEQLEVPFVLADTTDSLRCALNSRSAMNPLTTSVRLIQSMDRTLVF